MQRFQPFLRSLNSPEQNLLWVSGFILRPMSAIEVSCKLLIIIWRREWDSFSKGGSRFCKL